MCPPLGGIGQNHVLRTWFVYFKGLVLYLLDKEQDGVLVSMSNVLKLTSPEGGLATLMKKEIEAAKKISTPLSENCSAEFNRFMAASERTQGNVLTNMTAPLSIFSGAVCAAATDRNDFDLRDVRKKRISIYLGISPERLATYEKLINLFFSQLISENTVTLPEQDPSLKYQCLLVLDEFASMGRVDIIAKAISYTAGYNMRFLLIFQSQAQLEKDKLYGKHGTKDILDNCAVKVIYPPKEVDEHTKSYSETLGYKTVKATAKSKTRGKNMSSGDNVSEQRRALMMPQEIVELGNETHKGVAIKEIIMMEKVKPFIADKVIYFDEPIFNQRKEYANKNRVAVPLLDLKITTPPQQEKQHVS